MNDVREGLNRGVGDGWGGVALIAAVVLEARAHHQRGGPPKVTGDPNARERERELQAHFQSMLLFFFLLGYMSPSK